MSHARRSRTFAGSSPARGAPPQSSGPPLPAFRSEARRQLFAMVLSIVVLDAVAIALYYGAGLSTASRDVRTAFTAAWTVATLAVAGLGLRRIRRERRRR